MKKTGKLLVLLMVMFAASIAFGANVKVNAVVDRDQMGIGDSFTLNISVQSDEDFELTEPELPKVPGLEVINAVPGGRQSSSSMTIINGKTQFIQRTSQDYNFVLSPQKEGVFVIPAIDVKVKGQSYRTNPVKVEVQEEFRNGRAKPKGGPRFPPGYGGQQDDDTGGNPLGTVQDTEDLFEQMLQQQQRIFGNGGSNLPGFGQQPQQGIPSRKLNIDTNDAFFVYLDLDKAEVYEGEQITANWYIYTRSNVESLDRVKFPDLRGFWKEIIEEVPALHFTEEIVNGMRYRKALLASHGLFPIKAGVSVIDEFRIKAKVRMPTQFGWGQAREYTKTSRRAEIKVLPLPQEGRGKTFSGAVGNYQISVKTEGTTFPANQPFSVKVRYEGVGNAKLIDLPTIAWPDGLEVYDTKSESKFFREGHSFKEFEILVIARKEGALKIPPFELTYFDPRQKKYISEATPELVLQITPGDKNQPVFSGAGVDTKKPAVVAEFKPQAILELPRAGFSVADYRVPIFLMTLLFGFTGLLAHFFLQLRNLKFKPAFLTEIKNKLGLIEKYSSENEYRKIGSEATNVIYILVANLAGQKKADQELHLLINEIPSKDQQLYLQRITQLFDYFQLLGFSPEEIMQSVLKKKPLKEQIEMLKILAKEIVAKLRKQDKYNE